MHQALVTPPTDPAAPSMRALPLRLNPGDDLRQALEAAVAAQRIEAAFVVCGIGSLRPARLRLAGAADAPPWDDDIEILTLSGSIAVGGSHLHMSAAGADGQVRGGHVAYGCIVRTTAEVLLALLPAWRFTREHDAQTGYDELMLRPVFDGS